MLVPTGTHRDYRRGNLEDTHDPVHPPAPAKSSGRAIRRRVEENLLW